MAKTFITKTYGKGKDMKSNTESKDDGGRVVTDDTGPASVTCGLTRKVSDAVYWGDGTWDKIPFSVEVFTSVTLSCGQTTEELTSAKERAYEIAWETSEENMGHAVVSHVEDIKGRLFKHLF